MRGGKREIVFILQQFAVTNNACNRLTTVCIDCIRAAGYLVGILE